MHNISIRIKPKQLNLQLIHSYGWLMYNINNFVLEAWIHLDQLGFLTIRLIDMQNV